MEMGHGETAVNARSRRLETPMTQSYELTLFKACAWPGRTPCSGQLCARIPFQAIRAIMSHIRLRTMSTRAPVSLLLHVR